jgi:uncharacterized protein
MVPALGMISACTGSVRRVEVVKPTTPADDSKANSSAVPAVLSIQSKFERVVIVRLKYDTDLLGGLEGAVAKVGIKNAVILGAIGSVRSYAVHSVVNRTFPSRNVYVSDPMGPADIAGMSGYVIDGRVHAHIVLTDPEHAFGGHLERDTRVFTFAVVTLGVLSDGIDLSRVDDKTYR